MIINETEFFTAEEAVKMLEMKFNLQMFANGGKKRNRTLKTQRCVTPENRNRKRSQRTRTQGKRTSAQRTYA